MCLSLQCRKWTGRPHQNWKDRSEAVPEIQLDDGAVSWLGKGMDKVSFSVWFDWEIKGKKETKINAWTPTGALSGGIKDVPIMGIGTG
jgi:hypothetical protein